MQTVRQSVGLKQRSTDLGEGQLDERVGKLLKLLLGISGLRPGIQCPVEELDEGGKRKLVHIVHLEQVTEDHEEVGTND